MNLRKAYSVIIGLIAIFAFVLIPLTSFASITDGSIDPDVVNYKYAWSEMLGWINLGDTLSPAEVHVSDYLLTGYIWSQKTGWIHLAPTLAGVTNNGEGNLDGYAWGEGIGYIDFDGVSIDTNGYFTGYATSTVSGSISFNCINTASCGASDFKTRTDWRPQSVRPECNNALDDDGDLAIDFPADSDCTSLADTSETATPPGGGGGGGGAYITDGSININNGATCTTNPTLYITLTSSAAQDYYLSQSATFADNSVWTSMVTTPLNITTQIGGGSGLKNVYVLFRSTSGNLSAVYSDSIQFDLENNCGSIISPILDSDSDGISDAFEGTQDQDGDGVPNYLDTDSDSDGIPDSVEGTSDSDNDGILNYLDPLGVVLGDYVDSDRDLIPDSVEGLFDNDNDGIPNYLDTDSDNDGVPDNREFFQDLNLDGVFDYYESISSQIPMVILYEHINYLGRYEIFRGSDRNLKDNNIGNDIVSSLRVIGGAQVRLFEHRWFVGDKELFLRDEPDLRNNFIGNDRVSSIIVTPSDKKAITPIHNIVPGDIFKGETSAVYYLGGDYKRYTFPHEKVFKSWYKDFKNLKRVSEVDAQTFENGGVVTYKPASRLLKSIDSSKVYVVTPQKTLRWITTPEIAVSLYGQLWKFLIDDLSQEIFNDYAYGQDITTFDLTTQQELKLTAKTINELYELPDYMPIPKISLPSNELEAPDTLTTPNSFWSNVKLVFKSLKNIKKSTLEMFGSIYSPILNK